MLKGVNDHEDHARELLDLVCGIECKFNLIVFNPHEGTKFEASDEEQVLAFRSVLIQGGRVCTIRSSRGSSEMAACGQLGNPTVQLLKRKVK
jgi:23S rRNA (adenine2503-C2)-methyltransferase